MTNCQCVSKAIAGVLYLAGMSSAVITWEYFYTNADPNYDNKTDYPDNTAFTAGMKAAWDAMTPTQNTALFLLKLTPPATWEKVYNLQDAFDIELSEVFAPDSYYVYLTKEIVEAMMASTDTAVKNALDDVQAVPHKIKLLPDLIKEQRAHAAETSMQKKVLIQLSPGAKANDKQAEGLAAGWEKAVRGVIDGQTLPTGGSQALFRAQGKDLIELSDVKGNEMLTSISVVASQPEAGFLDPELLFSSIDPVQPVAQPNLCWLNCSRRLSRGLLRRLNDEADDITQSGSPGSAPFKDAGLNGSGEVVGVGDSGLDDKSCFFNGANINLPRDQEPNFAMPKVIQYIAFADGVAGEANDHGTHVAGTVAGRCSVTAGQKYDGMASAAKIHLFDIGLAGQPSLRVPRNLATGMFQPAKEAGAAIHTNSWGANTPRYTSNSRDVDLYSWQNPEFVVLVAAGNSGAQGPRSIGSPATAKNCIAVGASVNPKGGGGANSHQNLADFSSIGPTADGRIGITVTAPGHPIFSAASLQACSITRMSGTSMATPAVAGTVAVVRQYFREGWWPSGFKTPANGFTPSGALLKAIIVHSGRSMQGTYRGANIQAQGFPSTVQGFGLVDLNSVLKINAVKADRGTVWQHSTKIGQGQASNALTQGATYAKTFTVTTAAKFKATLVWMDYPGSLNARKALVNDLDLTVAQGGITYKPNGLTGNARDSLNNVEMIEFDAAVGTVTVTVTAQTIASPPTGIGQPAQPYALVVSGQFNDPDSLVPTPAPTTAPPTAAPVPTTAPTAEPTNPPTGPTPAPTPEPPPVGPTEMPGPAPSPVSASGYTKLHSGSCSSQTPKMSVILDVATCNAAAAALSLKDTTATTFASAGRPQGCYLYKQSNLYLGTNPASTTGSDADGREQICQPNKQRYKVVRSGSCASQGMYAITNPQLCEDAATELGLADATLTVIRSRNKPEGCYYRDRIPGVSLFFATNPNNANNGASNQREPICATSPAQRGAGSGSYSGSNPFGGAGVMSNAVGSVAHMLPPIVALVSSLQCTLR
jgi:hypothetical protein